MASPRGVNRSTIGRGAGVEDMARSLRSTSPRVAGESPGPTGLSATATHGIALPPPTPSAPSLSSTGSTTKISKRGTFRKSALPPPPPLQARPRSAAKLKEVAEHDAELQVRLCHETHSLRILPPHCTYCRYSTVTAMRGECL